MLLLAASASSRMGISDPQTPMSFIKKFSTLRPPYDMSLSNSSIQSWLDLPPPYLNINTTNLTLIPQLSPCISLAGLNVSCADLCHNVTAVDGWDIAAIFNVDTPANLVNCGLWRTASYSVALGGIFRDLWLQDENIENFRSVGFRFPESNFSALENPPGYGWASCLQGLWNMVHPIDLIVVNGDPSLDYFGSTITASPCDSRLVFLHDISLPWYLPICMKQLCNSTGLLDPDVGGVGVCSLLDVLSRIRKIDQS
jgi:hypothetical protein